MQVLQGKNRSCKQSKICKLLFMNQLFFSFGLFPSGVATENHLLPSNPVLCILFSHTSYLHVLFHDILKAPPWSSSCHISTVNAVDITDSGIWISLHCENVTLKDTHFDHYYIGELQYRLYYKKNQKNEKLYCKHRSKPTAFCSLLSVIMFLKV